MVGSRYAFDPDVVTGGREPPIVGGMSASGTRAPAGRRRRQWTAAERTACLRAFAASGQSATAFCRERGVPRATLTLWRRTASAPTPAARPAEGSGARFVRGRRQVNG